MRSGTDVAFSRVTVLAPRTRVDLALPADVPVADLVPMLLELVGEPLPGSPPEPWRLSGAAGGALPPAATLAALGVLDGDLLRLGPDSPAPTAPVFDDPVDALAATAGGAGAGDRRSAAAAVLATATGAAVVLAGVPGGPAATVAAVVGALAAAVAVVVAARLARRPVTATAGPDPLHPARTLALTAVPLAAAAGWVAPTGSTVATQVLLAAVAAGTAAAAAQIALRVVAPVLVGIVTAAVPTAVAALVSLRFGAPPPAAAAAVAAAALVAGPVLPRLSLRLAGVPAPVVPADGDELVEADDGPDVLPPDELAERADLARGFLAGLAGGSALLVAVGAVLATGGGGWAGPAFAGIAVVALGLRARSFADPGPARTAAGAAVAAGSVLAVLLAAQVDAARVPVALGLLLVAAGGALVLSRARPAGSPVSRRAVDLLEAALVVAAVPLAFGAMDLYRIVRGL